MKKVLYSQSTQEVKPYPRNDDEPVLGLDPDYLILNVVEAEPPEYNPDLETVSIRWEVDLASLEYRGTWVITDLPSVPDWENFNKAFLADPGWQIVSGQLAEQGLLGQQVLMGITSTAANANPAGLQSSYYIALEFMAAGGVSVPEAILNEWKRIAELYNIPISFDILAE